MGNVCPIHMRYIFDIPTVIKRISHEIVLSQNDDPFEPKLNRVH